MALSDERVSVRAAVPADVEAVRDVQRRSPGRSATPAFRDHIARAIENASSAVFIAETNAEAVGWAMTTEFANADASAPAGHYLMGITVAPEFRRRGVATRLVEARLDWIRALDDRAYYFTNVRNMPSIALHERFGFREAARGPEFHGVAFDGGSGVLFSLGLPTVD